MYDDYRCGFQRRQAVNERVHNSALNLGLYIFQSRSEEDDETSILRKLCEWMTTISMTFSNEKLQMRFNPDSSVFKSTASIKLSFCRKI